MKGLQFENLFPKTSEQLNNELTRNIGDLKPETPEEKKTNEEFNNLPNKNSEKMATDLSEEIAATKNIE
jgi:hypothetical protein